MFARLRNSRGKQFSTGSRTEQFFKRDMNFQKTLIGGRFTRDHELKYTPKGTAVLSNSVAVNESWSKDGKKKESVTYFEITAFGITAENLSNYTGKGSPIFLEAKVKNESWEDKTTGQKRHALKFVVQSFQFVGSKGESQGGNQGENQAERREALSRDREADQSHSSASNYHEEDDIPF